MTFVGAPMTYYGDEAGMWSPDDPSNRQPMLWKDKEPFDDPEVKFDQQLFDFHQRLIAIRHHLPALQTGMFTPLVMDDSRGIFVFARELKSERVIVAINRSNQKQTIDVPFATAPTCVNWLDSTQAQLKPASDIPQARADMAASGDGAPVDHGTLHLSLDAYGTAILSPR
jgi:glycosidase